MKKLSKLFLQHRSKVFWSGHNPSFICWKHMHRWSQKLTTANFKFQFQPMLKTLVMKHKHSFLEDLLWRLSWSLGAPKRSEILLPCYRTMVPINTKARELKFVRLTLTKNVIFGNLKLLTGKETNFTPTTLITWLSATESVNPVMLWRRKHHIWKVITTIMIMIIVVLFRSPDWQTPPAPFYLYRLPFSCQTLN